MADWLNGQIELVEQFIGGFVGLEQCSILFSA
jgi:hypothetical protein